jgi:hypothetical protein
MTLALRLVRTNPLLTLDFTMAEIGAYQPPVYQPGEITRSATSVLVYRQQALAGDLLSWTITVQTTNLNKILQLQQLAYWCRSRIDNNQDPGLTLHDLCYPWVEEAATGTRPLAQGAQDVTISTNPAIVRYYAQFKVLLHSLEPPERRGALTICSFLLDELEVLSR